MTVGGSYMSTCWADSSPNRRCHNRVPLKPDHIGLCDRHLEQFRDHDYANDPERKVRRDGPQTQQGHAWAQEMAS